MHRTNFKQQNKRLQNNGSSHGNESWMLLLWNTCKKSQSLKIRFLAMTIHTVIFGKNENMRTELKYVLD